MKKLECKKCGKVVEGYNAKHVQFLMDQHMLKHKYEEKVEKEEN
jgi:hypothetical protein